MATDNYKVIDTKAIATLQEQVNKAIEDGWRPLGGICCYPVKKWDRDGVTLHETIWYAQAMGRSVTWT